MSLSNTIDYLLFDNPLSKSLWDCTGKLFQLTSIESKNISTIPTTTAVKQIVATKPMNLYDAVCYDYYFIRFGGVFGATAICFAIFGRQYFELEAAKNNSNEGRSVFETANHFHFLHTLGLMLVPMARKRTLTGILMGTGLLLFCGPTYYRAFTGDKTYVPVAAVGGFCLIGAWLSFIL